MAKFVRLQRSAEAWCFRALLDLPEILDLIAQRQNNSTISIKLPLGAKTVQNFVSSILTKLQAANRVQSIVRVRQAEFGKKEIVVC